MSARYAAIYDELQQRDYRLAGEDIALRQLQNVLLGYLTVAGDNYVNLSQTQFDNATNMTDRLAALQASVWGNASNSTTLVEAFDKQWRGDKLVMDKWFQTQALADTDGTIANIKALMKHPDFSLDNPNRIYSLLAAFTQNSARFHQFDGAGYTWNEFLQWYINPQLACDRWCEAPDIVALGPPQLYRHLRTPRNRFHSE